MTVSFPGLGLNDLKINREIFTIGRFSIYWYAVIITTGILLAILYAMKNARKFSLTPDNIYDAVLIGLPLSIVGARLYYVLFDLKSFGSFLDVINLRNGGLAIYGGVIGAAAAALILKKWRKINILSLLDVGALGFLIGQSIGRWGNFVNGEVYGVTTKLPWRMVIKEDINTYSGVHPLFLYESLWNIIGFLLLHNYVKRAKKRFNGELALLYVIWYGLGRGFLEGMRQSGFILKLFGNVGVSQVLGFLSAAAAAVILLIIKKKLKDKEMDILSDDEETADASNSILGKVEEAEEIEEFPEETQEDIEKETSTDEGE